MSSTTTATPSAVNTTPLLPPSDDDEQQITPTRPRFLHRPPSLRGAARFLRRATSRTRSLREPSVRVREAATEQIEERQTDWGNSKPVVILDLIWNLAFVIVSVTVLVNSRNEKPSLPLRLWIVGYAMMCALHMACVCVEYRKRCLMRDVRGSGEGQLRFSRDYDNSSSGSDDGYAAGEFGSGSQQSDDDDTSVAKHLESANTMFSFIWWIIGFYWISAGGENLITESPQLYWLCIAFLAFDVFFVVICVAVACVIGIAVCCCLPCIIAILYAVADQEGATKEDIERLPKFKFQKLGNFEKENGEIQVSFGGMMVECDTASPSEHVLSLEDAECCICLCAYDDGAELRELPCRHHFHSACIDKWLHLNATCPLCKFNILKNGNLSGSEDA